MSLLPFSHPQNQADSAESLRTVARAGSTWWLALAMTVVIASLLLLNSWHYLFQTELYEFGDPASNSLFVREAKQGLLLHGHYSRWSFYHPGPAFLSTLAVGEALFYDTLHVVPTPFNAQYISLCLTLTFFFSLALAIFARRLGSGRGGYLFFLPLALLFATWHYGALYGVMAFTDIWPPCPLVLAFLCFVVAVASTACGGGEELPVLVLSGGWLVHIHVAQPLFIVPCALLAYAGLLVSRRRLSAAVGDAPRGILATLRAGWRIFPRAHWIAVVLLALYLLPLFLDALHGGDSNLARIITHLRSHQHEPSKKFLRSLCYFLTFGGYDAYAAGSDEFRRYSAVGMLAFVERHWRAYAFWVATLVGAPALFFAARWRQRRTDPAAAPQSREHFIPWFYVSMGVALIITLVWGMKQDGPMTYFNAYFNYSIYFCAALGLAAALAAALIAWTDSPKVRRVQPIIAALLWISVVGAVVSRADHFRLRGFGTEENRLMARTAKQAAATLPQDAICFVDCRPWSSWPIALAVVLELDREGRKVRVNDTWEVMCGKEHTIQKEKLDGAAPVAKWVIVPQSEDPARLNRWSLGSGLAIDMKEIPDVNPAGQRITFSQDGNYGDYAFFGWSVAESDWTWSEQRRGLLQFRPLPLPESAEKGVDMLIAASSFVPPGQTSLQRVEILFNGTPLETIRLPLDQPDLSPVRVHIGAEAWRHAVTQGSAKVLFRFLDAQSPGRLGISGDIRLLGGKFRSIEFQPAS